MAHAAIAYAKAKRRRRAQAVTSSIGPGSTNMVTAAALAHVNRLPVLFICGDVFANRRPDPVLQQIEDFDDGTVSANDCFRPVTRYFDRISRPEHILTALPRALRTLTDPADCGPVCLAFCQDVQAEAYDYPESFFEPRVWRIRRPEPDPVEVAEVVAAIRAAKAPVIVAGGGVLYSGAEDLLADFAGRRNIPIVETQAGKGATGWEHPMNFGSPGVTGSACGNEACAAADLVIGVGTRFQDFTTGSWTVFANPDAQARLDQRPRLRRAEARRHRRRRRRQGDAREDRRRPRRDALRRGRRQGPHRLARHRRRGHRRAAEGHQRAPLRRPGDRRGAAGGDRGHRRHVRRRHHAGRAAGALAGGQGRLPHGVRLLLHGLRGRRRHGDQARRARRRR